MPSEESMLNVTVIWRGNKYVVEMNFDTSLKQLGDELQKLTGVKAETMRLIIPQALDKGSRLLSPFSDEHSGLSLQEVSIIKGKSIRMMGVSEDEVDKVLQDAKVDLRIAGFDEEEKRIRQRASYGPQPVLKLPQGPYIFRDFRTLELAGIELNPPASEALKRMHMLAADPGIVAIMNKHHWCIGIMTEMAPVGYVGVSPKCILGFNKNHGEEISLRLRTDDLKGFRKYESIKKTLLHELAHMVYSEHDANFYALDKQLNEEAASLDWTKSKGYTLTRVRHSDHHEEDVYVADNRTFSQKLGGNVSDQMASARASSVAAAYRRLANASPNILGASETLEEPDPDDSSFIIHNGPVIVEKHDHEPDPDEHSCDPQKCEPDPDDSHAAIQPSRNIDEPDPDDLEAKQDNFGNGNNVRPHRRDSLVDESMEVDLHQGENYKEPDPDESQNKVVWAEPDPDDSQSRSALAEPDPDDALVPSLEASSMQIDEPDPDDQELWRIQDPVTLFCSRLQKTIEMLRAEVGPKEATGILQTLFKIIRNVIENQDNLKFKRLRKANPIIQKNIANHKAAMEILQMVGFSEDVVSDELGKVETYLVLKRNDPGLLWLAKSSLEACVP